MFLFLFLISLFAPVLGSTGDRSLVFVRCFNDCHQRNCSGSDADFMSTQPLHMQLLDWTCADECKYMCMWRTVDAFNKDELPVPQFYGKWPFIRFYGIQEPASVLFSILNGLSHVIMLQYLSQHLTTKHPMYYVWFIYAIVAMNAWTWSTIFHTRDTNMTEMMDYFCATLFVMYSVFCLIVRISYDMCRWLGPVGGVAMMLFYIYHVHYLAFVSFSYSYNMLVNVCLGLSHAVGWVGWCIWFYRRTGRGYVWRVGVCALGVTMLSLLELGDFPPIGWVLDAHALWHGSTIPVAFIWYRFAVDDSKYLRGREERGGGGELNGRGVSVGGGLSSVSVSESKKTT